MTTVDPALSASYGARLNQILTAAVVDTDGQFICAYAARCEASTRAKKQGFAGGQLSYVGDAYASTVGSNPLRILVLSMQNGDAEAPVAMARRAEQVLARIVPNRNPHMRGVTRALQLLHGLTIDPADELLSDGTHVLRAYAMANSTLCSALPTEGVSRRGSPTHVMLRNCGGHLEATIKALEPTVIHTQGKGTRDALERIVTTVERVTDEVSAVW